MERKTNCKFELRSLPYEYNALEPYIDEKTVYIHHQRHLKGYVDNLNKTLNNCPQYSCFTLKGLLINIHRIPSKLRTDVCRNAGGVYNHNMYFDIMTPNSSLNPTGTLEKAIKRCFDTFENFKNVFKRYGIEQFGSGWVWLVSDKSGKLKIMSTKNQDVPTGCKMNPILILDVWEHAYYLKYQNKRAEYIDNWFNLVNWKKAEINYMRAINM